MSLGELERRVRAFVAHEVPALAGARALLAVSGGADSVATAAMLLESGVLHAARCAVAHFDHALRGDDAAARGLAAVQALCARYRLELETARWESPRPGEAAAREARYGFLAHVARSRHARYVVTGHTLDDQAETVLMNALRGAGVVGLCGMAADGGLPHGDATQQATDRQEPDISLNSAPRLARPALCTTRRETRAYCDARGLDFADDASNEDRRFLRNRIRLDLLPAMERSRPGARAALLALAEDARVQRAALDALVAPVLLSAQVSDLSPHVVLSRAGLRGLTSAVRAHAFRAALVRLFGDAREFERRHYDVLAAAADGRTGARFQLPRSVVATVDAETIVLAAGPIAAPAVPVELEANLPFEGDAGGWWVRAVPAGQATMANEGVELRMPAGAVVRGRRPGDRVTTRAGTRKLADWYIDRKIPRRERDAAPVVAYGGQVLWTPFAALGELPHGRPWRMMARRVGRHAKREGT